MHPTIRALIDLDDINKQRQILLKQRSEHQHIIDAAAKAVSKAKADAEKAAEASTSQDALIRQYQSDIERCDQQMADLREKQMTAKSNKDYLACINGVEEAKQEKRLRTASIEQLEQTVSTLQEQAEAAAQLVSAAEEKLENLQIEFSGDSDNEASGQELERLYQEQKAKVDSGFLNHYERLISSGNKMPIMKLMVLDPMTNSILYIEEEATLLKTPQWVI